MAGIMHFSNFFRFMEVTEHAFYRSLGFSVHPEFIEGKVGWPRVHVACEYKHPLRFEEEVEIQLLVKEKRTKAVAGRRMDRTNLGRDFRGRRDLDDVRALNAGPRRR